MKKLLFIVLLTQITFLIADEIKIGILAFRSKADTIKEWAPTIDYFNSLKSEHTFTMLPLTYPEMNDAVKEKKIDFVITNPGHYVYLEKEYRISRIATMMRYKNGRWIDRFGGVIFTRANTSNIKSLIDLKNKKIAAVDSESLGGYAAQMYELKNHNIEKDELKLYYTGMPHANVVKEVLDGKADAGFVRTDVLEDMARSGKIKLNDIKIIHSQKGQEFPYLLSTALYPEWPIAQMSYTSKSLSNEVVVALLSRLQNNSVSEGAIGWCAPMEYREIHEIFQALRFPPYDKVENFTVADVYERYWYYAVIILFVLFLSQFIALYIARINAKLRDTQHDLEVLNNTLEEKIKEKTEHLYNESLKLEEAYFNEKYLRSILRTVADVNQMLITTQSVDELIDKAALCLSSNESLKNAKISIVKDGELILGAAYGAGDVKRVTPIDRKAYEYGKNLMITNMYDAALDEECQNYVNLYAIKGIYALPLKSSTFTEEVIGVLTICTGREGGFSVEEQKMIEELAGDIGFALNSFTQQEQINALHEDRVKSYQNFIDAMVNMIEQRDTYTAGHTVRVAHYAELIAREMKLPEQEIQKLVESAKLHDIGKVVTPDSILLKPGKLSKLEYELIKEHAKAGYEVLSNVHLYKELADIMIDHHERYDGSGYPDGKKEGEISLLGHIMAVADSFDAMTTNRIYKPRKEIDESLLELNALSGIWYHPAVVNAALKVLADVNIDTSINQMASSALEEERMSYFFKDRLTKLYNEDYFTMTLNGRARHPKPAKLWIVSLVNFHRYNKTYGWERGNTLISEFAAYLSQTFPGYQIFRIWGDRFVIADFDGDIEILLAESPLVKEGVEAKIKEVAHIPDNLEELMHEKI